MTDPNDWNCAARGGKCQYTVAVGAGLKSDFEPVSYGESAQDTLYRRVEYSYLSCRWCATTIKRKVTVE